MDSIPSLLGLALRAGRLAVGEEPVGVACRCHKGYLLLLASDAADNTIRRALHFCQAGKTICLTLPLTKQELGSGLGRASCAMLALTDVGFAAAVDYLGQVGLEQAAREEQTLARALWEGLRAIPEVELPVSGPPQAGIVSFTLPPFHPYDVALLLDQQGVAVRSGTHCAHPLFDALGMPQGVVRASLGLYNTLEDVERLCRALRRVAAIKL